MTKVPRLDELIEDTLRHLDDSGGFGDDIYIAAHDDWSMQQADTASNQEGAVGSDMPFQYSPPASLDAAIAGRVLLIGKVTPQDTTYEDLARRYGSIERLARGLHGINYEVIIAGSRQHTLAAHQASKIYGKLTHAIIVLDEAASDSSVRELLETADHLRYVDPSLPIMATGSRSMIDKYRSALRHAKRDNVVRAFFDETYLLGMLEGKQGGGEQGTSAAGREGKGTYQN